MRILAAISLCASTALPVTKAPSCACVLRKREDSSRPDYGSFCASWDADDEDPWCSVGGASACGEPGVGTFLGDNNDGPHYWSRLPCTGRTPGPPPAHVPVGAHSERAGSAAGGAGMTSGSAALRGGGRGTSHTRWSFGFRNWTFPEVIVPRIACRGGTYDPERVAIATYITALSSGYARMLQRWFLAADHAHPEVDKVIVIPLSFKGRSMLDKFVAVFRQGGARLSIEELAITPQASDLAGYIRQVAQDNDNCCDWTELKKIAVWTMTKYSSVLLLDTDIVMLKPVPELFRCEGQFDFLSTAGAAVALNGGMQWLRPSMDTYRGLLAGLAAAKGPEQFCNDAGKDGSQCRLGWWGTGRLFSKQFSCETPDAETLRRAKGPVDFNCQMPWGCKHNGECRKGKSSYGMETNQGYLFYFFHINAQRDELAAPLRTAQVNPCVYDLIMTAEDSLIGNCVDNSGSRYVEVIGDDMPGVKMLHKFGKWKNPLRKVAEKGVEKVLRHIKCCPACESNIPHHPYKCNEPSFRP